MTDRDEYAICSRCQLADCDDNSPQCGLRHGDAAQIKRHVHAIEAARYRNIVAAERAVRKQLAAA